VYIYILPTATCQPGNFYRLSNGPDETEGRLEVCEDNRWGAVCNNDALVVVGVACQNVLKDTCGERNSSK